MKTQDKRTWYHGDTSARHTLGVNDADFSSQQYQPASNRDPNAQGPGIYFTNLKTQAHGYAYPNGFVYSANVDGPFVTDGQLPTRNELLKFIGMMTVEEREMLYSNWSENHVTALATILQAYKDSETDFVSTFVDLGRQAGLDVFDGGQQWVRRVVQATRYNGFIHKLPRAVHLIVWNPAAIVVTNVEPYKRLRK